MSAAEPPSRAVRWALPLAVFAAAWLPFLPALSQGFVELDDDRNFLQNENYRGLSAEHLEWMFTQSWFGHYQPLSWVTLAVDHQLWGLDGRGYHLTNLLLHALGAVFLYHLIVALLRPFFGDLPDTRLRVVGALAALLHAVHPLRVESVAWATERRDVQSGLFLLLAVLCYVRRVRAGGGGGWLALSLLAYVASLLSKAWGITLPALLLVLDVWPLRRRAGGATWARLILEKLWYVAPAALVAWKASEAQSAAGARMLLENHSILQRIVQAAYGLSFYVVKTLWPTDLSALYWLELDFDPARPLYVAACVFALAVTAAVVVLRRRWPAGLATWAAYAVIVSPVLGFLQSGFQKVADRYTYLACMPFAVLAGAGLAALSRPASRVPLRVLLGGTCALLAVLGILSWRQTRVWKDSETLYRRVVAVEPDNYFGWHNLAVQLHKQGRYDEAIEAELHSIEHHPGKGNELARYNLGNLYRLTGRNEEAVEAWLGALEAEPAHLDSLLQLKTEYLRRGDFDGICALFERAVEHDPGFVDGWREWAEIRRGELRTDEAIAIYRRAMEALPEPPAPFAEYGTDPAELARRRVALVPRHRLAALLIDNGRAAEAEPYIERAFHLDERNIEVAIDYARMFGKTGRMDTAQNLIGQVLQVAPNNVRARRVQEGVERGQVP